MTSVEYSDQTVVSATDTREYTDPDTGETVTREIEQPQHPFEVRISKWLERSDGYHVHGFVEVTEFGQKLASQSDAYEWVRDTYETASGVTETVVLEWLRGVGAVQASKLGQILLFGNVNAVDATVNGSSEWHMDFNLVLDGATKFNINWLSVYFDPLRGGN